MNHLTDLLLFTSYLFLRILSPHYPDDNIEDQTEGSRSVVSKEKTKVVYKKTHGWYDPYQFWEVPRMLDQLLCF